MKQICLVIGLVATPLAVSACPKGTSPVGGYGPHHKGGTCSRIAYIEKYTPVNQSNSVVEKPKPLPSVKPTITQIDNKVIQIGYSGFTTIMDCTKRAQLRYQYNSQLVATPSLEQYASTNLSLDKNIPSNCQQTSNKQYLRGYDATQMIPATQTYWDPTSVFDSSRTTNVLPMNHYANLGMWQGTEDVINCLKFSGEQYSVYGGAIYNNKSNDIFVKSHGIETPDLFWKIVVRTYSWKYYGNNVKPYFSNDNGITRYDALPSGSVDVISWIFPNTSDANLSSMKKYMTSIEDIERQTGISFPFLNNMKYEVPAIPWNTCNPYKPMIKNQNLMNISMPTIVTGI